MLTLPSNIISIKFRSLLLGKDFEILFQSNFVNCCWVKTFHGCIYFFKFDASCFTTSVLTQGNLLFINNVHTCMNGQQQLAKRLSKIPFCCNSMMDCQEVQLWDCGFHQLLQHIEGNSIEKQICQQQL